MIGEKPSILNSKWVFWSGGKWRVRSKAPKEVKDEFNAYMGQLKQGENAPGDDAPERPDKFNFKL